MNAKSFATMLGLDAGVLWLVGGFLGWGENPVTGTADLLWKIGIASLLAGAAVAGYSVVPTAPLWLRVVVTLCSAAMVGLLVSVVAPEWEAAAGLLVGAGAVLAVGSAFLMLVGRKSTKDLIPAE